MSVPYGYDQTNIEHLRAVVAEQEATIEYLHGRCKEEEAENARLRVFASCAYGIASKFMRLNGCPYYDNGMECGLSDECEGTACAEHPDCLLDALAKALGIEVDV